MKRLFLLFFLLCSMTVSTTFAQEKKAFTLEDVIPGGNNYFNLVPKNIPGLKWWGDVCVRADVDDIRQIDNRTGEETILVTLKEVNEALQNGEKPYKLLAPIKPLHTLQGASLPWENRNLLMFSDYVGDEEKVKAMSSSMTLSRRS